MLQRLAWGPWPSILLVAVVVVTTAGMRAAIEAAKAGDELRGVAIIGLVSVLISPISWIHHLVCIVPVLAAIVADGRNVRRVLGACTVAVFFAARLPYIAHDPPHMHGASPGALADSYGLACIALLAYLARSTRQQGSVRFFV